MDNWYDDIQYKVKQFVQDHKDYTYEMGDSQTFLNNFFKIFKLEREKTGAEFEVHPPNSKDRMDLFWSGKLLVEMKSANKNLDKAMSRAVQYYSMLTRDQLPTHILVSDFQNFYLLDKTNNNRYRFTLQELPEHIGLFGFMIDKPTIYTTDPVNQDASNIIVDIFDSLKFDESNNDDIEYFLTRIVFCLFADDTNIFEQNSFQNYIKSTKQDGSDLGIYLEKLFKVLNTPNEKRSSTVQSRFKQFQYIDGDLFDGKDIEFPEFTDKTRELLIQAGEYDWSKVSPVIFGSMFQNVMDRTARRGSGSHYTTEENILKVIQPLFMSDLYSEFDSIIISDDSNKINKLVEFQDKLSKLTFFDPACGSGNFLSITYKEIRRLEHNVLYQIKLLDPKHIVQSKVDVNQFYGIELGRFSSKIAEISIWMMDHLMNMELTRLFGKKSYRIPLKERPNIICGDALEINWNDILPADKCNYILGNPPFAGYSQNNKEQRFQIIQITNKYTDIKTSNLDYVTGWFIKAGEYCTDTTKIGLVSTNSICQGEQVYPLWTILLDRLGLNIQFAYKSFTWTSETKGTATVSVIIIGLSKENNTVRYLYNNSTVKETPYITPYLNSAKKKRPIIQPSSKILNGFTPMKVGVRASDDFNYIFTEQEKDEFLKLEPNAEKYMKKYVGADDFINDNIRYILALKDIKPSELRKMPHVMERVKKVKEYRLNCKRAGTKRLAKTPLLYESDISYDKPFLILPVVSTEKRDYMPIGFINPSIIIPGSASKIIPDVSLLLFALLTSRMHNLWLSIAGGRLGTGFRYSNKLVYNTFPVPKNDLKSLESLAQNILDIRDKYKDSSLADLYDPDTMPADLLKAHQQLDKKVESLYRKEPFADDDDRLEFLLEEYSKMIGEQSKL